MKAIFKLFTLASILTQFAPPLPADIQHEISASKRQAEFHTEQALILNGYDVISYHQDSGPIIGRPEFQTTYKGIRYHFINQANLDRFKATPEQYEPLYGAWCAYAMLDGTKTEVDPETYKIVDGKILLFYNGFWGDTLKAWNKQLKGQITDQSLIQQADAQWAKFLK